jgi:hypothetical protein
VSAATALASCPAGARAFGGGVTIDDTSNLTVLSAVRASQPTVDGSGAPIGWTGTVVGVVGLAGNTPFHVYAICG